MKENFRRDMMAHAISIALGESTKAVQVGKLRRCKAYVYETKNYRYVTARGRIIAIMDKRTKECYESSDIQGTEKYYAKVFCIDYGAIIV